MSRVAHIVWGFKTGGIETMLVNILNRQVESIEVVLIVINDLIEPQLLRSLDSRVRVITLARKVGSRNPLPLLRLNLELLRLRPDTIHSHSFTVINYLLPQFRSRCILTYHTTLTDCVTSAVLKKYSKIYAISNSVAKQLESKFGVESKVVYNGIMFSKIESRDTFTYHTPTRIVQVGRLKSYKGHLTALKALSTLTALDWHFDIIGEGEMFEQLAEYVKANNLESRVTFLGNKSQEYIFTHLKEYDILLQPSVAEGFGLSVAEGMAAKVTVVVSDADGLTEVVNNGKYGHIFVAQDSSSLATVLSKVIECPDSKEAIEAAYTFAVKNFDINNTATAYLNDYNDESSAN